MKAARYYGYKDIRIEDIAIPQIGPDEVLIQVSYAGICGTDRHEYTGPNFIPSTKPHRLTGKVAPITIGHEFSGVIAEVGENVSGWKIGERVTASGTLCCRACQQCLNNKKNICELLGFVGVSDDGTMAEYVRIHHDMLYHVPDEVPLRLAPLSEPLACGQHAINILGSDLSGKNVFVSGGGIIGMGAAVAAKIAGANHVILAASGDSKRQVIEANGIHFIDFRSQEVKPAVLEITGGKLCDITIECVGNQQSIDTSIDLLASGGKLMVMGVFMTPPTFKMNDFQEGERSMYTSQAHNGEMAVCLDYMKQGYYKGLEDWITLETDLENVVAEGFEELERNARKHTKVLIRVSGKDK